MCELPLPALRMQSNNHDDDGLLAIITVAIAEVFQARYESLPCIQYVLLAGASSTYDRWCCSSAGCNLT